MNILVTGSTGLLGQALTSHLARSCDVVGLSRSAPSVASPVRHMACDLLEGQRIAEVLRSVHPDVIIHAQALSDVDRCEREPDVAVAQNVHTTQHLVEALQGSHTLLLHVSTDYVFDGTKTSPYVESDVPRPLSVYGRSKLDSEQVALRHPRTMVIRTSTLFGPGRMNFCDHLVDRLMAREPVEAFVDQITSPTYTVDVAEAISEIIQVLLQVPAHVDGPRLCHLANVGGCSRVTFGERVADLLGCSRQLIRPIRMADQHRPAPRPPYSALASTILPSIIGRTLRSWDEALPAYLRQRHWLN